MTRAPAAAWTSATGLLPLDVALDVRRFGGKAASLSDALAAGLPVPPGIGLDVEAARRIAEGDAALATALHRHVRALGGPVAVRSSAIGEDSGNASFAGQHRTVLGVVGAAALESAVRDVVASGRGSQDYRATLGLDAHADVAVVVQRMVDAELAGVAFTRHPVSGARELVIEFCSGLGEILVSGRATPAMLRLSPDGDVLEQQDGHQSIELRLRADGTTEERPCADTTVCAQRLSAQARAALRDVAARAEALAGEGRDLEWAWSADRLWLLQSRPITTAPRVDAAFAALVASHNVLHGDAGHDTLWSRVNVGEAIPGTVFPLTAEFHLDSVEVSPQRMFQRMGVQARGPVHRPGAAHDSPSRFLLGRLWVNVDYMRAIADRIPGTSGHALEEAMFGRVRPGVASAPTRDRYGAIAVAMVRHVVELPGRLHRLHADTHRWWRDTTRSVSTADLASAVAAFDEACTHYAGVIDDQCLIATLAAGFWEPVAKIVRRIGTEDDLLQLTAGYGTVLEARMLERLWAVSRGSETLDGFIADYGYMAAGGGELANPSWREHRAAVERIVEQTATLPESEHPSQRQARSRARYEATRSRLIGAAPIGSGIALRVALRLAARMLPVREVGKACMAMGQDVGRACVRRIGVLLAERGDLDAAADVRFLTRADLHAAVGARGDLRSRVAGLHRLHAFYEALRPPEFCTGTQLQQLLKAALDAPPAADGPAPTRGGDLRGVGVSRGRHTGIARVVLDPNRSTALQPGDILVCNITDPGWTALFSIAGALVVDVGGMLSHAAIIARELGIPAVVNTRDGTRRIPDGARITVDGATGDVTLHEGEPA